MTEHLVLQNEPPVSFELSDAVARFGHQKCPAGDAHIPVMLWMLGGMPAPEGDGAANL